MTAEKEKAKKTAKEKSSDEIIEGEVVDIAATEEAAKSQDAKSAKAPFPLGMFSAVILSLSALGLSGYLWLDSLAHRKAIDEHLLVNATNTAERAALIDQRLAVVGLLETQFKEWQKSADAQNEAITNLSEIVTTLSAPQAAEGHLPVKGLIGMLMWQDMKDGQSLSDYQMVLASLPDGAPALADVITKWQALDFQNLLEEGYDLARGAGVADKTESLDKTADNSPDENSDESFMTGLTTWFANLINLRPFDDNAPISDSPLSTQISNPAGFDSASAPPEVIERPHFDEIYKRLLADDTPQAVSWRGRADKARNLQDRLLSLSVSWLSNKEPSS